MSSYMYQALAHATVAKARCETTRTDTDDDDDDDTDSNDTADSPKSKKYEEYGSALDRRYCTVDEMISGEVLTNAGAIRTYDKGHAFPIFHPDDGLHAKAKGVREWADSCFDPNSADEHPRTSMDIGNAINIYLHRKGTRCAGEYLRPWDDLKREQARACPSEEFPLVLDTVCRICDAYGGGLELSGVHVGRITVRKRGVDHNYVLSAAERQHIMSMWRAKQTCIRALRRNEDTHRRLDDAHQALTDAQTVFGELETRVSSLRPYRAIQSARPGRVHANYNTSARVFAFDELEFFASNSSAGTRVVIPILKVGTAAVGTMRENGTGSCALM